MRTNIPSLLIVIDPWFGLDPLTSVLNQKLTALLTHPPTDRDDAQHPLIIDPSFDLDPLTSRNALDLGPCYYTTLVYFSVPSPQKTTLYRSLGEFSNLKWLLKF